MYKLTWAVPCFGQGRQQFIWQQRMLATVCERCSNAADATAVSTPAAHTASHSKWMNVYGRLTLSGTCHHCRADGGAADIETSLDALGDRVQALLSPHLAAHLWQHEPPRLHSSARRQQPWLVKRRHGGANVLLHSAAGLPGGIACCSCCVCCCKPTADRTTAHPPHRTCGLQARAQNNQQLLHNSSSSSRYHACGARCAMRTALRMSGTSPGCCVKLPRHSRQQQYGCGMMTGSFS
jgi:hypothetical protein